MRHLLITDRRGWMALGLGLSLVMPMGVGAATYTWDGGGGNGSWGTAANWNAAPAFNNTADLVFSGSVQTATYLVSARNIRSLAFNANADTPFSISLSANVGGSGVGRSLTFAAAASSITIDPGASAAHALTLGGGSVVLAGNLTITHNGPADFSINRPITGAFNLTKTGTGPLTLAATNTFGAARTLTLSNGTINVNSIRALGAATCTLKLDGGVLDNTSGTPITLANNQPVNISGDFAFAGAADGTHDLNLGTGAVTLNGAAGVRTITVNSGTLTLGGVIGNGTANALTKAGAGTLMLRGASTYSGGSTVSGGTLLVNGSLAGGQVSVTNSGTLGGTGIVSGAVVIYPGSTLAPGTNDVGALTVANGVTFTGGALRVKVNATNSGSYGQVKVTGGNVTIANAVLALSSGVGYAPQEQDYLWLINNTGAGTVSGAFNGLPEGSETTFAGQVFRIYYHADSTTGATNGGNDVLLSSVPVTVAAPVVGWFSPNGVDVSGAQWAGVGSAIDSNTATYASHTSPGANQWGDPLWLTNATPFKCSRVRVYSDWDAGYVDKIRLEIRIQPSGVWTNVYEGAVQNCNWSEITFGSTNIDAARYSYHYVAGSVTFWLYEFQFYADSAQVNLPSCQSLDATSVEETSAILHGTVLGDGGEPCQYRFQYGLTTSYTANSDWSGSLSANDEFSASISGLATNSTYHYRAQIKNSAGIASSEDKTFATGLPPTGWVSPTGYAASGAWTNIPNAFDDDLNSFATCYHRINDPVWSPDLYLTHSTMTCERIRFNVRDTAEIDMATVDVDLNGSWTTVYNTNTFLNQQWAEASFPRGTVTQARVRFSLTGVGFGVDWQLYEFKFYRVEGVTLSGRYDGAHRVSLAVDGQYRASFTNFTTNVFTFAESIGAGSKILIFYDDDNVATNSGALVTKATGGDMANLDLTANTLVLRHDVGAGLTGADLVAACASDADVPFSTAGNNITIASNISLWIPVNSVVTPDAGTMTLYGDLRNDGALSFVGGAINFAGNTRVSGVSTTVFGNVTITGSLTAHSNVMQVAGNWVQSGIFSNNNGMVDFSGTTAVSGITTASFNHVKVTGSLTAPAGVLKVGGDFVNHGTFSHNNGTVLFDGTSVIGGTVATTFGNLAIAAAGSLTAPAGLLYVSGNWSNSGLFSNNNGTVIFTTPSIAVISGTTIFKNVTCTTPGKQLTFAAGTSQTVLGALTVSGNSGSRVLLRSSLGGSKWAINFPNGPQSVTYVDVRDADAFSNVVTVAGGADSGNNNANWVFASSRYWVGGNGNWSDTNHWAFATGGAPGASVPDVGNLVVFDGNSGAGAQCQVNQAVNVKAMILDVGNTVTLNQGAYDVTIQNAGFLQNAGAFVGGSGNFEAVGVFQLAGGSFTAPSKNLTLRSDFNHSGGVFSNQSGTVVFAGNTVITDLIADPFANVVISNSVTGPAGSMYVIGNWRDEGDFSHNNGTVVLAGNSLVSGVSTSRFNHLRISGSVTGSPGAMAVAGAWVNNGAFIPNNGTVLFSGNTELAGTSTSVFCNVVITDALVAPISKPFVIVGNWVNNGSFNPNNGTVLFSGATEISGASISAFNNVTITGVLVGHASNPVTIAGDWIQNGSFSNQNGTVVFNGDSVIGGSQASKFSGLEIWGHLTAPATNLYVAGNWINYGTFSHNNGTVIFDGSTLLSGSMVSDFNSIKVVGLVTLDSGELIGDASAVTVSGVFSLNDESETIASLAGTGSVQLGVGILTLAGNASTTFGGVVGQNGGLVKQGSGTFTLSGVNTYSGATMVDGGGLVIGAGGRIASSTNISVSSSGQLTIENTGNVIDDSAPVNLQSGGRLVLADGVNEDVGFLNFDGVNQAAGTWGAVNGQFTNTAFFAGNGVLRVLGGVLPPVLTITNTVSGMRLPFRVTQYTVAGQAVNVVGGMWYTNAWSGGQSTGTLPAGADWSLPLHLPSKGIYTIIVCGTNAVGTVAQESVTVIRSRNQVFWFAQ